MGSRVSIIAGRFRSPFAPGPSPARRPWHLHAEASGGPIAHGRRVGLVEAEEKISQISWTGGSGFVRRSQSGTTATRRGSQSPRIVTHTVGLIRYLSVRSFTRGAASLELLLTGHTQMRKRLGQDRKRVEVSPCVKMNSLEKDKSLNRSARRSVSCRTTYADHENDGFRTTRKSP